MISRRIKLIASLLDSSDKVLDVGTDHALLPVYLTKNSLVLFADGSDISQMVINGAKRNLAKYNLSDKIQLYISDGLKNIDVSKYNTLVIAGMGFNTIKGIILNGNLKSIKKLIIQSNNDLKEFRSFITNNHFVIEREYFINDKDKDYIIFKIIPGNQTLDAQELNCGIYNADNKMFYKNQITKLTDILKKVSRSDIIKASELESQISFYKDYLAK